MDVRGTNPRLERASPARGDAAPNPMARVDEAIRVDGDPWLVFGETVPTPMHGVPIRGDAACRHTQRSDPGPALGVPLDEEAMSILPQPGEGIISTGGETAPKTEAIFPEALEFGEETLGDGADKSIGDIMPSGDRGIIVPMASKLNWLGCRP